MYRLESWLLDVTSRSSHSRDREHRNVAEFKTIRPSDEIRLRRWPPGRVSQLKIVVANLEQSINRSLASQVKQVNTRRFSEFIPVIPFQDITGEVEFREIRVFFTPPKGLKNLLFYEFHLSRTAGFFQFTEYNSPNPSFVFSGLEDQTRYFVRIRVVTSEGFVGPFSDSFTGVTPTAKAAGALDTAETTTNISSSTFTTIFTKTFTPIGGKLYYSIQYNCQNQVVAPPNAFEYSTLELQWLENDVQKGQNFLVTNYSYGGATGLNLLSIFDGEVATAGNPLTTTTAFQTRKRGTFIQKFHITNTQELTVKLNARIANYHTLPNEFSFNAGASINSFAAPSTIAVKNFTRFEVLTQVV